MNKFKNFGDAVNWIETQTENRVGAIRIAYFDDPESLIDYDRKMKYGKSKKFDREIFIGKRKAIIGCDYE